MQDILPKTIKDCQFVKDYLRSVLDNNESPESLSTIKEIYYRSLKNVQLIGTTQRVKELTQICENLFEFDKIIVVKKVNFWYRILLIVIFIITFQYFYPSYSLGHYHGFFREKDKIDFDRIKELDRQFDNIIFFLKNLNS